MSIDTRGDSNTWKISSKNYVSLCKSLRKLRWHMRWLENLNGNLGGIMIIYNLGKPRWLIMSSEKPWKTSVGYHAVSKTLENLGLKLRRFVTISKRKALTGKARWFRKPYQNLGWSITSAWINYHRGFDDKQIFQPSFRRHSLKLWNVLQCFAI